MRTVNLYGQICGGPYFDDLHVGQVFDAAPSMTLTAGVAAAHQAILGDRLRLALDAELSTLVAGAPLVHPGLVCDVAIGQSTVVTQRVLANLFYRGLTFHRFPVVGDTLFTRTEVIGLKQNSARPGRPATGLAALRMTTTDGDGRVVLDFHRCAMLPLSADTVETGHSDDMTAIGAAAAPGPDDPLARWDLEALRSRASEPGFDPALAGTVLRSTADVVSSAPELARLTLNIAATHHDSRVSGRRLVYGGHTIGLALAQAGRLLPGMVTVLGWQSCDHTAPVHEGDTLYSDLTIEAAEPRPDGPGATVRLRSIVYAVTESGDDRSVLDWVFTAVLV